MPPARRWLRLDIDWDSSRWLVRLHGLSQLAWIRLLSHAKRSGIKGRVKALHPDAAAVLWRIEEGHIVAMLEAAIEDGALVVDVGEWVLPNWAVYQEPDGTAAERQRRYRADKSRLSPLRRDTVTDRNVTGGNGVTRHATETETKTLTPKPLTPLSDAAAPDPVLLVFEHWRQASGHSACKLTKDRRLKIKARLVSYSVEQLQHAVTNACGDPFYRGDNDRGTRYDFPETILKSDAAVDRHLNGHGQPNGKPKPNERGRYLMTPKEIEELYGPSTPTGW